MRTDNEKYCFNCGEAINSKATECPKCGVAQPRFSNNPDFTTEWLITLFLCAFFGALGVHRFYTGRITSGIFQLITLGGLGIWALVDLIMVVLGEFKDKNGVKISPRPENRESIYC